MLGEPEEKLPLKDRIKKHSYHNGEGWKTRLVYRFKNKFFTLTLSLNSRSAETERVKEFFQENFDELEFVVREV